MKARYIVGTPPGVLFALILTGFQVMAGSPLADVRPATQDEGEARLAHARAALPRDPLELSGVLITRRPRGLDETRLFFRIELRYGDDPPRAVFNVHDERGGLRHRLVVERGDTVRLQFLDADGFPAASQPSLDASIEGTDLTWLDLTFDYLWWKAAGIEGADSVRGRDCTVVVALPVTPVSGTAAARLWIDNDLGVMLRAEQLDETGRTVRSMWVRSIRKIDDRWMVRDIEIDTRGSGRRTRLHVEAADFSL